MAMPNDKRERRRETAKDCVIHGELSKHDRASGPLRVAPLPYTALVAGEGAGNCTRARLRTGGHAVRSPDSLEVWEIFLTPGDFFESKLPTNASYLKEANLKSTKEDELKRRFIAFGLGLLTVAAVLGIALLSSGDLRLVYLSGALLLFGFALWLGASGKTDWAVPVLLALPLLAGFGFFLLTKVPGLWPGAVFWVVAVITGVVTVNAVRARRMALIGAVVVTLLAGSFWYCLSYLPKLLAQDLNHFTNTSVPEFTLQPVSGASVPTTWKAGKVLVIDFFATWCIPCKAELPELEAVQQELRNDRDIQFVLVGGPVGGDTPQRLRSFASSRNVTIPVAFDPRLRVRGAFHSTGLPTLVVIDRTGHVRLHREGFNPAETNFKRDMVRFLQTL
jgi:thiol-disulfide isomerase/thioredoxin